MKMSQFQKKWIGGSVVSVAAVLVSSGAQAATVYCPGTAAWQSTSTAPATGRYVEVTNAAFPGKCFYQDGNLQNSDYPTVASAFGISPVTNFLLLDKNGTSGIAQGSLTPIATGLKAGTWSLTSNLWPSYSSLYLGFHFGGGSGTPDSFVVQLENGKLNGAWDFLPDGQDNGLSNYYLFGVAGDGTPPPGRVPEPGSLALVGLALLAAGAARRRLK